MSHGKMAAEETTEDYPQEIDEQLTTFDSSVNAVKTMLEKLMSMSRNDLMQKLRGAGKKPTKRCHSVLHMDPSFVLFSATKRVTLREEDMTVEKISKIFTLDPLDQAKLELMSVYTLNSLFWMYLVTKGINPREHGIKQELERIRTYMNRVKEITDKKKAARLDKGAASRFLRNALYDAEDKEVKKAASKKSADTASEAPHKKRPKQS